MERRNFLKGLSVTAPLMAGCIGSRSDDGDDSDIKDSDGDGVIDSEDYAPKDSEVQEKSDLDFTATPTVGTKTTTPTTTHPTTTTTTTTKTTTTTATPTTTEAPANTLEVTDEYWKANSYITEYSSEQVSVRVQTGIELNYPDFKVFVSLCQFPRGDIEATGESEPFDEPEDTTHITVPIETNELPTSERLQYIVYLGPGDKSFDELSSNDVKLIAESDPFEIRYDGRTIERSPPPDALEAQTTTAFERTPVEGAYAIRMTGRTQGQDWAVGLYFWKSAYVKALQKPRGRSRTEYVNYELTAGSAKLLAGILNDQAEANGFTDKRTKVEFVIDFVQRLPYVPDDVSKGFDDYTKFITETITEGGGDCEDSAILLASVLEAEPFNYDMVLIQPPSHMAAGIKGADDLPGVYYNYDGNKYYYIETTGEGWGIGDIPDRYEGESAYIYQV